MSRLKGAIYRSMDSLLGHANPVGHSISDLAHQLHINIAEVNMTAVGLELDSLLAKWRWVRSELDAGRAVDMTKHWNPHLAI